MKEGKRIKKFYRFFAKKNVLYPCACGTSVPPKVVFFSEIEIPHTIRNGSKKYFEAFALKVKDIFGFKFEDFD